MRTAGVVVDETGQPRANVRVALRTPDQRNRSLIYSFWVGQTDDHGRFEVDLPAGEFDLVASCAIEGRPLFEELETTMRVAAGTTDLRVVLPRGATITGKVLLDGAPVPHFGITLSPANRIHMGPMTVRDSSGRFTLDNVGAGTWRVAILGRGTRQLVIEDIELTGTEQVDLGDIAMPRGQRLVGRVRDATGAPVQDARVLIAGPLLRTDRSQAGAWFMGQYETQTTADGEFAFETTDCDASLPDRLRQVWAQHDAHGASLRMELPTSETSIDLALHPTGRVEGIVGGLRGQRSLVIAQRSDEPLRSRAAWIDNEDGRFAFERLPVGDYVISVETPPSTQVMVTVSANETSSVVLAVRPTVQLTVRVPVGRAQDVKSEPAIVAWRSISHDGTEDRCTIGFVAPGEYRFSLDGETWTTHAIAADPAEQMIDLR